MTRETVHIVRSQDATTFHEHAQCTGMSRAVHAVEEVSRDYAIEKLDRIACPWCSENPPRRGGTQEDVLERLGLPRDLAYNPAEGDGGDA